MWQTLKVFEHTPDKYDIYLLYKNRHFAGFAALRNDEIDENEYKQNSILAD